MVWQLCFHNDRCFLNTQLLFPRKCHQGPGERVPRLVLRMGTRIPRIPGPNLLLLLARCRWTGRWGGGWWRREKGKLTGRREGLSHIVSLMLHA